MHSPAPPGPALRHLAVVAGAVVLGVLLLPSATRPPGPAAPAGASVTTDTSAVAPPPTTAPATSTTSGPAPALIHVLVANGTTAPHGAATIANVLVGKGFGTLQPIDATTHVSASAVYAVGGDLAAAQAVAAALALPATSVVATGRPPVSSWSGATVVVIVGPDLVNRYVTSAAGSTSAGGAAGTSH